ncbi:uncharacterized protein DUF1475 [Plasticicumulans lactativorans]|uniref:Uncharacterized protein DUF1475 n=1 Tax=Plasticicumulans lactativorans TaxID=1133106 RepID=A0A4R2L4J7_9GAMM|nr:DUF1475 family protein [Plasticicumulans lactativorans]TCO80672.1 uncharacterized protein DUF1475 [Plasticicumulans lactativorans]
MRIVIIVCGVLLGLLMAGIISAAGQANVLTSLVAMARDPWGLVTLLDLGVGLMFVAAWIALVEPSPLRAAAWIAALFVLGNVVTLLYLICHTPRARSLRELVLPAAASRR